MSKFKGGLDAYKQRQATTNVDSPEPLPQTNSKVDTTITDQSVNPDTSKHTSNNKNIANRKASTEYQQVNTYVPKKVYKQVKIALIEDEIGISDLITQLLTYWLSQRKK